MFLCAAGLVLLGPLLLAQAEPPLAFEVASVKPIRDSWLIDIHVQGETVQASGSVQHLVAVAHGAKDYQVFGGPSWIHSTDVMFEIVAKVKAQPEAPNRQQIRSMLQALLAERFQLTLHTEERELPVYMLAIAGGKGLKLTKAASDAKSSFRLAMGPVTKLTGTMSMTNLAFQLALRLHDRPVLDRTGLSGMYDVSLEWSRDDTPPSRDNRARLVHRPAGTVGTKVATGPRAKSRLCDRSRGPSLSQLAKVYNYPHSHRKEIWLILTQCAFDPVHHEVRQAPVYQLRACGQQPHTRRSEGMGSPVS